MYVPMSTGKDAAVKFENTWASTFKTTLSWCLSTPVSALAATALANEWSVTLPSPAWAASLLWRITSACSCALLLATSRESKISNSSPATGTSFRPKICKKTVVVCCLSSSTHLSHVTSAYYQQWNAFTNSDTWTQRNKANHLNSCWRPCFIHPGAGMIHQSTNLQWLKPGWFNYTRLKIETNQS